MSKPQDSSVIAGGATPIQPHRDVSAQLNGSHPVNEHGPTSAVSMMPNTSPSAPGPATPLPIYSASDTAPGAYAYMPRADAAQGLTQSPVPIAYRSIYAPAGLFQWPERHDPRKSRRKWIIWGTVISLSVLTVVGIIVGVLLSTVGAQNASHSSGISALSTGRPLATSVGSPSNLNDPSISCEQNPFDAGNVTIGLSTASTTNLQFFLDTYVCRATKNGTGYFYFEAFYKDWEVGE